MIDFNTARKIAAVRVREGEMQYIGGPDGILRPSYTPVIVDALTREFDFGWVFFHDSAEHQETQDFRTSLVGNVPLLVDRIDGSVHFIGAQFTVDEFVKEYVRKRANE